jgi:large subunit ribosomal protein L21
MYAIIRAGGKQHKVSSGDVIEVERLSGARDEVHFEPILVVGDDGAVRSQAAELAGASVVARIVDETVGRKVRVLKYRNKTGYRRHRGHRQRYTRVEISDIVVNGGGSNSSSRSRKREADGT